MSKVVGRVLAGWGWHNRRPAGIVAAQLTAEPVLSRRSGLPQPRMTPAYTTRWGRAYHADALEVLRRLPADSVALVLTSPPFALRRQKAYGNVAASDYVEWFWPFAGEIHRVLRPDGSFVLDLGPAWKPHSGTRSLYQYELVLR